MPISKYNSDGTVDVYNKKTGEVRSAIRPEELGSISPNLVAEYQVGQSPEKLLERKETEVKLRELESGKTEEKPLSAEASRLKGSVTSGLSAIEAIENILDPNKEKEGFEGRSQLFREKLPLAPCAS